MNEVMQKGSSFLAATTFVAVGYGIGKTIAETFDKTSIGNKVSTVLENAGEATGNTIANALDRATRKLGK